MAATDPAADLARAVILADEDAALATLAAMVARGDALPRGVIDDGSLYTALHFACDLRMSALASALLAAGWSPTAASDDLVLGRAIVQSGGITPLHLAARNGCKDVAEALLAAGTVGVPRRAPPVLPPPNGAVDARAAALCCRRRPERR